MTNHNEICFENKCAKKIQAERQCHARAILTDDQARQIFRCKPTTQLNGRYKAALLARTYGVSAKTVRDIWIGRTWYWATYSLDTTKPILTEKLQKKLGRPRGAKDTKPRSRKPFPDQIATKFISASGCNADLHGSEIFRSKSCERSNLNHTSLHSDLGERCRLQPSGSQEANEERMKYSLRVDNAWNEQLLCALSSTEFTDPFHDDWEFWPRSGDSNLQAVTSFFH